MDKQGRLRDFNKVYFIGIGGAGMSGIARVLLEMGCQVSGSDIKESQYTLQLRDLGADITIGHHPENIRQTELVVVSTAISPDNCEIKEAEQKKIPLMRRAEMIAYLGRKKKVIAVAGTHGKTTTTSMVSVVFEQNGLEPTFLIGGELNDIGSNARFGKGEYLITEADESDGSFLYLYPKAAIVTNIEADHLDFFRDLDHIEQVFSQFLDQVEPDGVIVTPGDQTVLNRILAGSPRKSFTYGLDEGNDFQARNLDLRKDGSFFDLYYQGEKVSPVALKVVGVHNVYNAMSALALAFSLGLDLERSTQGLAAFGGVKRRFEQKGLWDGVCLIDDYAHHPTEISATLEAARHGGWKRVICVFQPHRYSRTQALSQEFGACFGQADVVVLADVYAAGEEPVPGITGKLIADAVLRDDPKKHIVYLPKLSEITDFLIGTIRPGDLVLTMGAGDIWMVGEEFSSYMDANRSVFEGHGST